MLHARRHQAMLNATVASFFAVYASTMAVLAGSFYFASRCASCWRHMFFFGVDRCHLCSYLGPKYSFVPRFWFFAALGACYCRVNTRLSGITQAVLCGLVAQELGFYGLLPMWAAAKH